MSISSGDFLEQREAEQAEYTPTVSDQLIRALKPVQLSKSAIEGTAEVITELVRNGDMQALDVVSRLQYISDVCEAVRKSLREDCVKAVEQDGGKEVTVNGAKITIAETGTKYNYESCNDSIWKDLKNTEDGIADERKQRETFLKALPRPMAEVDGGEIINPPIKSSTTSIKISFPK